MKRRAFLGAGATLFFVRASRADALVVLGKFRTTYQTDPEHKARASNVALAAEAIDGKRLAPGSTFSFNDAVGERTAAFGYAKATVLRDGLLAEGMGGGACQVASTLYAAALLAGLGIVARSPHSRPSGYIRLGFDATVAYPKIDLKLENSRPDEVTLRARGASGVLDVWFEGRSRTDITLTSEILDRTPFSRTLETDRTLGPDDARRVAFGIPGFRVRRVRSYPLPDGTPHHDVRIDTYAAVPEILRVAPGFDEARLGPPEDEEHEAMTKVKIVTAPAAIRPLLVQLRPSSVVTLRND